MSKESKVMTNLRNIKSDISAELFGMTFEEKRKIFENNRKLFETQAGQKITIVNTADCVDLTNIKQGA